MEIKIDSKRNNPLLNRTEIYFTIKHEGEGTPSRELVRSELAEKLNAKKENVVINVISPGFGSQESTGYAKIYSSVQKTKDLEKEHILKRNKIVEPEDKEKKTVEKPTPVDASASKEATAEPTLEVKSNEEKEEPKESLQDMAEKKPQETSTDQTVKQTETIDKKPSEQPMESKKDVEQQGNIKTVEEPEEDTEKPKEEKKSSEKKEE